MMDKDKLDNILHKHRLWLWGEEGGERADLSDANLRNASLSDADLSDANLRNANLRNADLSDANLRNANLRNADLSDANLRNADLNWANMHEAKGVKTYTAGLQSSRPNALLVYYPSIDQATTGCWQGTWQATKDRINSVYDADSREGKAYKLAIDYIEAQMALDGVTYGGRDNDQD
jgi:hypothetical protein